MPGTGEFGVSFAPTGQQDQQNGQSQTPIQDAIKVLSLRIPQFQGGLAPRGLLTGPGSLGVPGAAGAPGGLDEFLRRLFGQMGGGMTPQGSAPAPNVVPGGDIRGPQVGRSLAPNPAPPTNTGESQDPRLVRPPSMLPGGGGGSQMPMLGGRPPKSQTY